MCQGLALPAAVVCAMEASDGTPRSLSVTACWPCQGAGRANPPGLLESRRMPELAAIVTGASRGIGLALAAALTEEGYGVTMTARKPDLLEQAANALRAKGARVEHVAANLADEEAVRAVVARH